MTEVPGRLIRDADRPTQLVGGHALFGFDHQEHGHEPFPQGKLGILQDGSDSYAELVGAFLTLVLMAGLYPADLRGFAPWASNTIRPADMLQIGVAFVFGAELLYQFDQVHNSKDTKWV